LDAHLQTLEGGKRPARLESIIRSLEAERAEGTIREPGKLVERRIEQANARARTRKQSAHQDGVSAGPFKSGEMLGIVGFGGKVTGADAMDVLAAVPGSNPDTVRRLIREVCGKWTGSNGKNKSPQHVVVEVMRMLRAPDAANQAEKPDETVVVGKPIASAKDQAAQFAALRKQMPASKPQFAPRHDR